MGLLCPLCRGDGVFRIQTTPVECPCGAARTLRQLGAALALADEQWSKGSVGSDASPANTSA